MVRSTVINDIREVINRHQYFDEKDFDFVISSSSIKITYKYNSKYFFYCDIPTTLQTNEDIKTRIFRSPGNIANTEKYPISNSDSYGISQHVDEWLGFIKEELKAIPIYREFEEQKEILKKIEEFIDQYPDEPFTREEGEALKLKLDDLEKKLIDNLQKQEAKEEIGIDEMQKEIKIIKDDIEMLKTQLGILSKKNFAKKMYTRVYNWLKNPINQILLINGSKVVVELLKG